MLLSTKFAVISLPAPLAARVNVEPVIEAAPVVFPAVNVEAAPDAKVVLPEEERVVKAAVDGVVAPIAVELMPVAVVLKLEEVKVNAFAPASIAEAESPVKFNVPEVAVKFSAPVVWVNPLEAVKVPAEVMVPVPVVEI